MINLTIQLRLIIFSFIFGFLFSIILDFFNCKTKGLNKFLKIISSLLLIVFMTVVYLLGIKQIGNAIFHIYSIISIIIGFISYDLIIKLIANNNKK